MSNYLGDWVIIKLLKPILLTKIILNVTGGWVQRAPGKWTIYGSNDAITWTVIPDASNLTVKPAYTTSTYTKSNIVSNESYLYFGLVVNELQDITGTTLNFSEWQIFGLENKNCQADWNTTIINKPDLTVYATTTSLTSKENALTFSAPLTRTTNTIGIDLSLYDTIALRNTALNSYLTTATASTTYATITNLSAKENTLTFSSPF